MTFFPFQILDNYDRDLITVESEIDRMRTIIEQRALDFIHLIENEKNSLLINIDDYIKSLSSSVKYTDLQQIFESINQRLEEADRGVDPSLRNRRTIANFNQEDFLLEIEHLNMLIQNREKQIQLDNLKYPNLTAPKMMSISEFFGELQWSNKPMSSRPVSRLSLMDARPPATRFNGHVSFDTTNSLPDESVSMADEEMESEEGSVPTTSVLRRQKQWSIDASGVPHFLCILSKKNCLLFACDKYGCIDLYQLDSHNPSSSPRHLRQFDLFPGNSTSQKPQIIEAFTVYTPFIVVSARKIDRTGTMPRKRSFRFE